MSTTLKWYHAIHNYFPRYERSDISFVNHATKQVQTAAGYFVTEGGFAENQEIHIHGSSNNDAWPSGNNHINSLTETVLQMHAWVESEAAGSTFGIYCGAANSQDISYWISSQDYRDPITYFVETDIAGYRSLGKIRSVFFRTFDKSWLHGKKIGFKWSVWRWTGSTELSTAYCEIFDGEHVAPTDFREGYPSILLDMPPLTGAGLGIKGSGLLQTIATQEVRTDIAVPGENESAEDDWIIVAPVTIDVSLAALDKVTVAFYFDGPSVDEVHDMAITDICIYGSDDTLLCQNTFNPDTEGPDLTFDAYETCQDYGYISVGEPPEEEEETPLPDDAFGYNKGGRDMFINKAILVSRFTVSDLPGVVFGGFLVDKYLCSQPRSTPKNGAPTISHESAVGGTAGRSVIGVPIWDYIMLSQAMVACCNLGKGWHLMTPFEWSTIAWMAKKMNTMPRGGNANTDPPSDISSPQETAILDEDLHAIDPSWHRALPGTGPNSWSHTGQASGGVYDLQGTVWQILMGFLEQFTGYLRYPANFDITYLKSPYGRGTISDSGGASPTLTCDGVGNNWLKNWTADEFNGDNYSIFIAEADNGQGQLFENIQDTTPKTIVLANGSAPENGVATFVILKTLAMDITAGMTSGNKITSLVMDMSSDLARLAIPATSDANGSDEWGKDVFYFDKASERIMARGGSFLDGLDAGIFALSFSNDQNAALSTLGFRAAKAL